MLCSRGRDGLDVALQRRGERALFAVSGGSGPDGIGRERSLHIIERGVTAAARRSDHQKQCDEHFSALRPPAPAHAARGRVRGLEALVEIGR